MARFESKIIGIDLGTTNTLVSYYDEIAKRGVCCTSREGGSLTPSAVFFENADSYIVGRDAKDSAILYPDRTALYFKRLMGETKEAIDIGGTVYSPQQLSAFVLKKVVEDANEELEEEIKDVVITVPAYFTSAAKQATKEAGIIAGLNVRDIIDEPCAALYHIDSINDLSGKTVMIFDLGGGTLDLIAAEVKDNEINEIAIGGDTGLGGKDWDRMLQQYIRERYLDGRTLRPDDEQDFGHDVEYVKISLTGKMESRMILRDDAVKIPVKITRSEFETCTKPLLDKVRKTVQGFMDDLIDRGVSEFDKIIMVGGASRMPQISEMLQTIFPDTELIQKDCDEAVAKGAAVYAKRIAQKAKRFSVRQSFTPKRLNRISARSYGIAALLGDFGEKKICNMIFKSADLPASVSKKFYTSIDNQKKVNISVYETTATERYADIDERTLLGNCELIIDGDIPRKSEILVDFNLRQDGTLTVEGKEPKGQTSVRAVMESRALLNADELIAQKDTVNKLIMKE